MKLFIKYKIKKMINNQDKKLISESVKFLRDTKEIDSINTLYYAIVSFSKSPMSSSDLEKYVSNFSLKGDFFLVQSLNSAGNITYSVDLGKGDGLQNVGDGHSPIRNQILDKSYKYMSYFNVTTSNNKPSATLVKSVLLNGCDNPIIDKCHIVLYNNKDYIFNFLFFAFIIAAIWYLFK